MLIISQESSYFESYFGVGGLIDAKRTLVEELLAAGIEVVLRPHPDGIGLDRWYPLLESYPTHFSISHGGYPIHYDLVRATAVVGLFSTAMPTAAASRYFQGPADAGEAVAAISGLRALE